MTNLPFFSLLSSVIIRRMNFKSWRKIAQKQRVSDKDHVLLEVFGEPDHKRLGEQIQIRLN